MPPISARKEAPISEAMPLATFLEFSIACLPKASQEHGISIPCNLPFDPPIPLEKTRIPSRHWRHNHRESRQICCFSFQLSQGVIVVTVALGEVLHGFFCELNFATMSFFVPYPVSRFVTCISVTIAGFFCHSSIQFGQR
jgi:hypothetical protein